MTKDKPPRYERPEHIGEILKRVLRGRRFMLVCGHHVRLSLYADDDVAIFNGWEFRIVCSLCGR
jgi:hypothetical protein